MAQFERASVVRELVHVNPLQWRGASSRFQRISFALANVRFWPIADIPSRTAHVRFWG